MKSAKGTCKKCGEVEISGTWTNHAEEQFMIPVKLAPTIQALGKAYKELIGDTYKYNTGNTITDDFEKKTLSLSHLCIDDTDWDEHMMEPFEVWCQIL